MQPKNLNRLLGALSRQGLDVSYQNQTYSVRLHQAKKNTPVAEVLLPADFPVEAKTVKAEMIGVVASLSPVLTFKG